MIPTINHFFSTIYLYKLNKEITIRRLIKINKNHLLFLFFAVALIAIAGCAKPECSASSDCSSKTCSISRCEDGKCKYTIQTNCCGNKLKEPIENGKPGSQCTCPDDYGKCEGKGKIAIGSRTEDATYLHYLCGSDNQCILSIDKKEVIAQNFLDSITLGFFKASSVAKYNRPFDVRKDGFQFDLSLDDISNDLILPVHFTKIKILFSGVFTRTELLVTEKELDSSLNGVGDQSSIIAPLNLNYKPSQSEESGSIRYIIDYEYTKRVLAGRTINGTSIYTKELVRSAFTSPSKPVFFVRSG